MGEETSQFNEDFKKNYNEENDEGYFLQADVQYLENFHNLHNNLPFLTERMKTENSTNLLQTRVIKKCYSHKKDKI